MHRSASCELAEHARSRAERCSYAAIARGQDAPRGRERDLEHHRSIRQRGCTARKTLPAAPRPSSSTSLNPASTSPSRGSSGRGGFDSISRWQSSRTSSSCSPARKPPRDLLVIHRQSGLLAQTDFLVNQPDRGILAQLGVRAPETLRPAGRSPRRQAATISSTCCVASEPDGSRSSESPGRRTDAPARVLPASIPTLERAWPRSRMRPASRLRGCLAPRGQPFRQVVEQSANAPLV